MMYDENDTRHWHLVDPETGRYVADWSVRTGVSFGSKANAKMFTTYGARNCVEALWSIHKFVWAEEVQPKASKALVSAAVAVWVLAIGLLIYSVHMYATKPVPAPALPPIVEEPYYESTYEEPEHDSVFDKSVELCSYYYANQLAREVISASEKHDIPVYVIYALLMTESELRLNPKNKCGLPYYGIGQLGKDAIEQYNWAHDTHYTVDDVKRLSVGVEISTWYYSWCYKRTQKYSSKYRDAYGAYNAGLGTYKKNRHDMRAGWLNGKRYYSMERFDAKLNKCYAHFYSTF